MTEYRLYLGRNIAGCLQGVTQKQFETFLEFEVVPRFPSFSLSSIRGYWRGKHELTSVLQVITEKHRAFEDLKRIGENYRMSFSQESVLLVSNEATMFSIEGSPI